MGLGSQWTIEGLEVGCAWSLSAPSAASRDRVGSSIDLGAPSTYALEGAAGEFRQAVNCS